jgi:hypothetical protein
VQLLLRYTRREVEVHVVIQSRRTVAAYALDVLFRGHAYVYRADVLHLLAVACEVEMQSDSVFAQVCDFEERRDDVAAEAVVYEDFPVLL